MGSTSWCKGFLHKTENDHNCASEPEFCNMACVLVENIIEANTGVDYVNSYTCACKKVHTGDDEVGGNGKRWHIARGNDAVGQTSIIQGQTVAQCSAACKSTSWCKGFLHKTENDHNCASEPEFCNGACVLVENIIEANTGVDYVNSHDCT